MYHRFPRPVRSIPVALDPFPVDDFVTEEDEVDGVVRHLHLNRAGVPSSMWAEHIRSWLKSATWEDSTNSSQWEMVIGLIQTDFCEIHLVEK